MRNDRMKREVVNDRRQHKINEEIRGNRVRLVGENVKEDIYDMETARNMAEDMDLDLVLVGPKADPVVCKIMDYQKFLYEQNKNKPKKKAPQLKEIRFTPNTGKGDLEFKTKHIREFVEKGHKVKVFVFFKGREMAFQDRGKELLLNVAVDLEDVAVAESLPKMEGRKMIMFLKPKK